jgi:hypothetical protein
MDKDGNILYMNHVCGTNWLSCHFESFSSLRSRSFDRHVLLLTKRICYKIHRKLQALEAAVGDNFSEKSYAKLTNASEEQVEAALRKVKTVLETTHVCCTTQYPTSSKCCSLKESCE